MKSAIAKPLDIESKPGSARQEDEGAFTFAMTKFAKGNPDFGASTRILFLVSEYAKLHGGIEGHSLWLLIVVLYIWGTIPAMLYRFSAQDKGLTSL